MDGIAAVQAVEAFGRAAVFPCWIRGRRKGMADLRKLFHCLLQVQAGEDFFKLFL